MGVSIFTRRPVAEDIATYLPATLELVLAATLLAVGLGLPAGLAAADWRDRWPDTVSRVLAVGAISMPRFFLGLLLQLGLAMALGWLLGGTVLVETVFDWPGLGLYATKSVVT